MAGRVSLSLACVYVCEHNKYCTCASATELVYEEVVNFVPDPSMYEQNEY